MRYILLFILVILLVGCTQQYAMMDDEDADEIMESHEDAMMDGGVMEGIMDNEILDEMMEGHGYDGEILAGTTTPYIAFNKEDYDKAIAENKIIMLYFYANWCPICKAEQPKVFAAFNEMEYENVIGFRANYRDDDVDEFEEQLAKEHGITYQHTKVIIKDGQRALKAPDSWNKERYLEEIKKLI